MKNTSYMFLLFIIINSSIFFTELSHSASSTNNYSDSLTCDYSLLTNINFKNEEPIKIFSNEQFLNFSAKFNLIGNGTKDDPIIFSNFYINSAGRTTFLILGVDLFFIFKNNIILAPDKAFELFTVNNGFFFNNTILNPSGSAFYLSSSSSNTFINNCISGGEYYGFDSQYSHNNTYLNNKVVNSLSGFHFSSSDFNNITKNIVSFSQQDGFSFKSITSNVIKENLARNNSIGFNFLEASSFHYDEEGSTNNNLSLNVAYFNKIGIFLGYRIINLDYGGTKIASPFNNWFIQNNASYNDEYGFLLPNPANNNYYQENIAEFNGIQDLTSIHYSELITLKSESKNASLDFILPLFAIPLIIITKKLKGRLKK